MSDFEFISPFQEPVDPAYVRFKDGWKLYVNDGGMFKYPTIRWHPRNSAWYIYPPPRWEMIDYSIPELDPPTFVSGFTLPQLFRQVAAAAAKYSQHPNLVWNPHTGAWRGARDTGVAPAKPPVPPKPSTPVPVADAAKAKALADREREMNAAYDEYRRGAIDIATLTRRLAAIEQRYKAVLG